MTTTVSLADEIRRYGKNVRDFFHAAQRASLISPLFNVPARLVLGGYCYFGHLPWILDEITATTDPEQIGERMKDVGIRPNYINLNALMLGYFNGREQHRLRQGLADEEVLSSERRDNDEKVVSFFNRVGSVYVEAESHMPLETGYRLPVLREHQVHELAASARTFEPGERSAVRRMMAVTELYTFILNGEARVGVFHHGPYPLRDGKVLLVKELVGLRDEFLPWELKERPPVDALARIMILEDVDARIDLFGSLIVTPFEYEERIAADILMTRDGKLLREVTADEISEIERTASDAQVAMYEQAASWSPEYQIAYGADLYASLVLAFCRIAGLDIDDKVGDAFHETAERAVPGLQSGDDAPLVLKQLGATEGELYSLAVPE